MKAYTNKEQSKKLVELGIDVNTADMWYPPSLIKYGVVNEWWENPTIIKDIEHSKLKKEYYVPCWSLSALLELIPTSIDEYTDDFSQLELTKQSVSYVYAIGILRQGYLIKDNLLGAAFEMICWLKENGKL